MSTSPGFGSVREGRRRSEKGMGEPYTNFRPSRKSPMSREFSMEAEGILKAWMTNWMKIRANPMGIRNSRVSVRPAFRQRPGVESTEDMFWRKLKILKPRNRPAGAKLRKSRRPESRFWGYIGKGMFTGAASRVKEL